jgi:hypothetical protein
VARFLLYPRFVKTRLVSTRMTSTTMVLALVLAAAQGCGGRELDGGPTSPADTTADGGTPGDGDPDCTTSPLSLASFSTEAELKPLFVGRWKLCRGMPNPGEEIGVEFADDGRWYPLRHGASGQIERVPGIDYGGTWQYYPAGSEVPFVKGPAQSAQMRIGEGGGDEWTSPPTITDSPRQMRILFSPWQNVYVPLKP